MILTTLGNMETQVQFPGNSEWWQVWEYNKVIVIVYSFLRIVRGTIQLNLKIDNKLLRRSIQNIRAGFRRPRKRQKPWKPRKLTCLITDAWQSKYGGLPYPNILRTSKHQNHVCADNSTHRRSSPVMYEVHPPLQGDSSLLPKPLYRIPQRPRGSLVVWYTNIQFRE